jgi:hypothetical protein
MAPIPIVVLFTTTLLLEPNVLRIIIALTQKDVLILFLLIVDSIVACFVSLTKFLVTKHTSALTLHVLSNAKGVVAMLIYVVGIMGYSLTVFGVVLYSEVKWGCK